MKSISPTPGFLPHMWTLPNFLNFHDNFGNFFCYQGKIVIPHGLGSNDDEQDEQVAKDTHGKDEAAEGEAGVRQVGRQDTAAAAALVAAKQQCIKEQGHCCARQVGRQDAAAAALVAAKQQCIKEQGHCCARQVGRQDAAAADALVAAKQQLYKGEGTLLCQTGRQAGRCCC